MRWKLRRTVLLLAVLSIATLVFYTYHFSVPSKMDAVLGGEHKTNYFALDWTGNYHIFQEASSYIQCYYSGVNLSVTWSKDRRDLENADIVSFHLHQAGDFPRLRRGLSVNGRGPQFTMIYVLESEANSPHSHLWELCDFHMWYNLDKAFPAPATYFDLKLYLRALLSPSVVPFEEKVGYRDENGINNATVCWMISNCHAPNGRTDLVRSLKRNQYIKVDSYGECLQNVKPNRYSGGKNGNQLDLYKRYKFVIAIENSNCEDYVSEKFTQVIQAGSVPIVAGKDGKPDYERFAPKNAYVNVYDFKSASDLAKYLTKMGSTKSMYEQTFMAFKQPENVVNNFVETHKTVPDLVKLTRSLMPREKFVHELLAKETSENKYCKVARYLYDGENRSGGKEQFWRSIMDRKQVVRPTSGEVCLQSGDLSKFSNL
ncbi:hypothetical protein ACOME3_004104 [Neoechinorhynchus agilis]